MKVACLRENRKSLHAKNHMPFLLTPTPCSARWPDARCQKLRKERTYALLYTLSAGKLTSKTHINLAKLRP